MEREKRFFVSFAACFSTELELFCGFSGGDDNQILSSRNMTMMDLDIGYCVLFPPTG